VLGEYPDEAIAIHIYAAVMTAAALMRLLTHHRVRQRPGLLKEQAADRRSRPGVAIAGAPIPVHIIAAIVADASATAASHSGAHPLPPPDHDPARAPRHAL
jgi:hypothetical protein